MILNYTEASAYAAAIAVYFMTMSMAMIIFVWAWQNIVTYFRFVFDDEKDEQLEVLEEIHASIEDLRTTIEQDQTVDLNVA